MGGPHSLGQNRATKRERGKMGRQKRSGQSWRSWGRQEEGARGRRQQVWEESRGGGGKSHDSQEDQRQASEAEWTGKKDEAGTEVDSEERERLSTYSVGKKRGRGESLP